MMDKEPLAPDMETEETLVEMTEETTETASETQSENNADKQIAEIKKQLDEAKSKYIYLLSDFENYKRNAAKERYDLMQTAGRDIMAAMLTILDDFDRAAKNGALTEGTTLIHSKLLNTLRNKGLAVLETKPGDAFNPDQQEAVAELPATSDDMKGKILDVLEPGYFLGDKLIRHAKVVVMGKG